MQTYTMPDWVEARVLRFRGRRFAHQSIDPARSALAVVDMQNHFVAPGFHSEVPAAREIVSNINRTARRMREAGGTVVWIQTTATGARELWANHHRFNMTPERAEGRLASLAEDAEGFKLYSTLEPVQGDVFVKKIKYSALIQGSSELDSQLRRRGIQSLLIAGTSTNVCCESTARDAMMLDYRVIVLSNATAARTLEEHVAALNNLALFFADVMTVDEALQRIAKLDAEVAMPEAPVRV
jgi:ureidoacrylate peracid hydrolase